MMGPWSERFERDFSLYVGTEHAISVNSCTTALTICLTYFGAKNHDVLIPAASFVTDVSSVIFAGGSPVLVDIDPRTLAPSVVELAHRMTAKTRGIIWVHLTGIISPAHEEIFDFARQNGLFLIEDASHAHGASTNGRAAGAFGHAACFSFYPTKIISTGTGGMITTNDSSLATFAREMRLFGKDLKTGEVVHLGNDWFMDEIRACIGCHQLADLDRQVARRRALAELYTSTLVNQPGITLLDVPVGNHPAWYQYAVFLADSVDHTDLIKTMRDRHGVQTKAIYKPTHEEQIFRKLDDGSLRNAENALHRSLCLPIYPDLANADAERVAAALIQEVRNRI
jgi:dTDP-4-amino-4,6-dideoxygalactose transaminase